MATCEFKLPIEGGYRLCGVKSDVVANFTIEYTDGSEPEQLVKHYCNDHMNLVVEEMMTRTDVEVFEK